MRKLLIIGVFLAVAVSFLPTQTQAGIVPCGASENDPDTEQNEKESCTVCHTFKLINNIEQFLLFPSEFNNQVPPIPIIATIFVLIGGFYLLTAAGNPERLQRAKTILTAAIVGLVIVYGALLIMGAVLTSAGVAEWGNFTNWIQVECAKPGPGGQEGVDIDFGAPN